MSQTMLPRRKSFLRSRKAIGCIVLIVIAVVAVVWFINSSSSSMNAKLSSSVEVKRGMLVSTLNGTGTVTAERSLNLSFSTGGTVAEVLVESGQTVTANQPLVRLDDRNLQIQLANAQAGLSSAQARWAQLEKGNARPDEIAAAQAAVKSAQTAYDAAAKSVGATGSQMTAAAAALEKAKVALEQAQSSYDTVAWRPEIGMLPQSVALKNATIDFLQAKANYETAITEADSKLQSAASQLQQAKANLSKLTTAATETDLAIQKAAVVQAEQSLKQAQLNLDATVLQAPFAGIITAINVIPGSQVGAGTNIATVIDYSRLRVDLRLNEFDVARIQTGMPVSLTIDSLTGWQVEGKVAFVSPASEVVNGVVTYPVRVSFTDKDARVKVGMTTNFNIVTAQKENVLLVPNSAFVPKGAGRAVQVRDAKTQALREVEVQTGLSDGAQTEIISGLAEGDQIIAAPTVQRSNGPFGQ